MGLSSDIDRQSSPTLAPIRMDLGRTPLIYVTFGKFRTDDLRRHLREMLGVLERGRAAFVYDVRDARVISAAERQLYVELFRLRGEFLHERCAGLGLIIDSALKRGVLTAIQWAVDIPFPIKVFSTEAAAEEWVRTQLDPR